MKSTSGSANPFLFGANLRSAACEINALRIPPLAVPACCILLALQGCDAFTNEERSHSEIEITPNVIRVADANKYRAATDARSSNGNGSGNSNFTLTEVAASYHVSADSADPNGLPALAGAMALDDSTSPSAIPGTNQIPYPLYPNARQYRVGGESGLQIVLFETEDPFYKVDAFYRRYIENEGLARLLAMSDYVRYAARENDFDAWASDRPGIVIHEFPDVTQAMSLGAPQSARTNIIMSF